MNGKDIVDIIKLVKKMIQYLLGWVTNKHLCHNHIWIRDTKLEAFNDRKSYNEK